MSLSAPYVAGYFDAEGCIRLIKRLSRATSKPKGPPTWALRVDFGQTNPVVVKCLARQYGGSLNRYVPKSGCKPVIAWVLSRQDEVYAFLADIRPFVREKRDEIEAALTDEHDDALVIKLAALKKRHLARIPTAFKAAATRQRKGIPRGTPDSFKRRREPSLEERAYLAGFFDGDGSLHYIKTRQKWMIIFGQCRAEGILLLNEVYGGIAHLKSARGFKRPQLRWTLNPQRGITAFLEDVLRFLIEKRAIGKRALSALRRGSNHN